MLNNRVGIGYVCTGLVTVDQARLPVSAWCTLATTVTVIFRFMKQSFFLSHRVVAPPSTAEGGSTATRAFALVLVSCFMAWFTYFQPGTHLVPGLDSSWAYGINYLTWKQIVLGREAFFTFGPLGFVEHTRLLSDDMVYFSSWFWVAVTAVMQGSLLLLAWRSSTHPLWRAVNVVVALAVTCVAMPPIQRLLLTGYALVCLHWQRRSVWLAAALGVNLALCMMIKFSYGMAALALAVPYCLLDSWRARSVMQSAVVMAAYAAVCLGTWWGAYDDWHGVLGYVRGGVEFSRGSATAMATNPENNVLAMVGFYTALLLAGGAFSRGMIVGRRLLPLVFIGPLYVWTKYAFGLQDGPHLAFLLAFVSFVLATWFIVLPSLLGKLSQAALLVACYLLWVPLHNTQTGPPDYSFLPQPIQNTLTPRQLQRQLHQLLPAWRQTEREQLAPLVLPPALRREIGQATVDIYPWETMIAEANDLNWTPRPVFQNYISYTPFLDAQNAAFFAGPSAPAYLLWHYHSFADITTRYPLSSDPLALAQILRHYRLMRCDGNFCLWQLAVTPRLQGLGQTDPVPVQWDSWIPLPPMQGDILRAAVTVERSRLGQLNLLLWKEGGTSIDYRLANGEIHSHDLIIDNARSGVWVAPYVDRLAPVARPQPVSRDRLAALLALPPAEGYAEKLEATPTGQRLVGWALVPFEDTTQQTQAVLLYNDDSAWWVPAERHRREGITAHFGKQGQVDLDQCGFYEELNTRALPAGDYRVQLVVENHGKTATVPDRGLVLHVSAEQAARRVDAIRLRTTKPWAYRAPSLALEWQHLKLEGEPPWQ